MINIVTYDVPDDRLRTKIAARLFGYGLRRLQKSVFIGEMSRNKAEMLSLELEDMVGGELADIRIFPVCERCIENQIIVSELYNIEEKEVVLV
ncbi:MAG: CRISPR-associated endonuclease Cas2 [Candidatus Freyarchaeum deiterrae]